MNAINSELRGLKSAVDSLTQIADVRVRKNPLRDVGRMSALPQQNKREYSSLGGIQQRPQKKQRKTMQRTSKLDRRSGQDRRKAYDLDYLTKGGVERRAKQERRGHHSERRSDWIMIDRWYSIALGSIADAPHIVLEEVPGEAGARTGQIPRKALRNILPFRRSFPVP